MTSLRSFKNRTIFLGVALLVLTAGVSGQSAGAAGSSDAAAASGGATYGASSIGGQLTPAVLEDISRLAKEKDMTIDEAINRYGWQESFSILVEETRTAFPDDFAGARIESDGTAWIAFKGTAPARAVSRIGEFVPTLSVVENRGFTETELNSRLETAHFAAIAQDDIVANASSGYDIVTGVIAVEIEPADLGGTPAQRAALESSLRERNPIAFEEVDLRIANQKVSGDDAVLYGGAPITGCTSGFAVIKSGVRGLSTAAHCDDNQKYGSISLTFQTQHKGYWGDVQWHTAPGHTIRDDFYYDGVHTRDVAGVGISTLGFTLYRYGKTTGLQSDTVYALNRCVWTTCHLTMMTHREAAGGDSGGPWYWGNAAYGIHQGRGWASWHYRDVFTEAKYVDDAIGVSIATW